VSTIDSGHLEGGYGGKKGQKKRFWSDEEKISICVQTCAPGVSVAQVAGRYAMNANLIHKWLRDPKFAPDLKVVEKAGPPLPFQPEWHLSDVQNYDQEALLFSVSEKKRWSYKRNSRTFFTLYVKPFH
jgi:transposase